MPDAIISIVSIYCTVLCARMSRSEWASKQASKQASEHKKAWVVGGLLPTSDYYHVPAAAAVKA